MQFERRVATITGVGIVIFVLALAWRNDPLVDKNIVAFLRIVLSLAMGALGATVPGFLNLSWRGGGLVVRAGGALALFVLTLVYTPTVLESVSNVQINHGDKNTNIINTPTLGDTKPAK